MDDVGVVQGLVTGQTRHDPDRPGDDAGDLGPAAGPRRGGSRRSSLAVRAALSLQLPATSCRRIRDGSADVREQDGRGLRPPEGEARRRRWSSRRTPARTAEVADFAGRLGDAHGPGVRDGTLGAAFSNLTARRSAAWAPRWCSPSGPARSLRGRMTPGGVVSTAALAGLLFGPVARLADLAYVFEQAAASVDRLGEILDLRARRRRARRRRCPIGRARGLVEFDRVGFGYRPGQPVVWDVRLRVEPGMKVALVGPTGCGKSTLVNLLLRFYDPTWGEIRLDGMPLRRARRPADLRRQIGVVPPGARSSSAGAWPTTSATAPRRRRRPGRGRRAGRPGPRLRHGPARGLRHDRSARGATSSARASGSGWRSPGPSARTRPWSSSTRPPARSTPAGEALIQAALANLLARPDRVHHRPPPGDDRRRRPDRRHGRRPRRPGGDARRAAGRRRRPVSPALRPPVRRAGPCGHLAARRTVPTPAHRHFRPAGAAEPGFGLASPIGMVVPDPSRTEASGLGRPYDPFFDCHEKDSSSRSHGNQRPPASLDDEPGPHSTPGLAVCPAASPGHFRGAGRDARAVTLAAARADAAGVGARPGHAREAGIARGDAGAGRRRDGDDRAVAGRHGRLPRGADGPGLGGRRADVPREPGGRPRGDRGHAPQDPASADVFSRPAADGPGDGADHLRRRARS